MSQTLNKDGSISTKADVLLGELEQVAKTMEIRSEALKNDQARLDSFMSNIKWMLGAVGTTVIAASFAVGYLGYSSVGELENRVISQSRAAVTQEIARLSEDGLQFEGIRDRYLKLETDYETYRTWADALTSVASETELGARDSRHSYEQINDISLQRSATQEDRLRALSFLEKIIASGINGEADPNDLFNAAVSASRMGMYGEALKLSVLAVHYRPSTSHRAFELQMQDLFGTAFTFDPTTRTLVESSEPSKVIREQAWGELMNMLREVPRIEAEQAYSRASNVAVRNRSAGYYRQMIEVIEATAERSPNEMTSYAYQTLASLYLWESSENWEVAFWDNVDLSLRKLSVESPVASWVEHSARELSLEASRINEAERLAEMAEGYNVDLKELMGL